MITYIPTPHNPPVVCSIDTGVASTPVSAVRTPMVGVVHSGRVRVVGYEYSFFVINGARLWWDIVTDGHCCLFCSQSPQHPDPVFAVRGLRPSALHLLDGASCTWTDGRDNSVHRVNDGLINFCQSNDGRWHPFWLPCGEQPSSSKSKEIMPKMPFVDMKAEHPVRTKMPCVEPNGTATKLDGIVGIGVSAPQRPTRIWYGPDLLGDDIAADAPHGWRK